MKSVMIIGGTGFEKFEKFTKIKQLKTIVLDKSDKHKKLADKHYYIDLDVDKIREIILKENPTFIISRCDPNIEFQSVRDNILNSWVVKNLERSIIGTGMYASILSYDKAITRNLLAIENIPIVEGKTVYVSSLDVSCIEGYKFPLLIKIPYGSSGVGTYVLKNEKELDDLGQLIKDRVVIIEEFKQGTEIGIEVIKDRSNIYFYPPAFLGSISIGRPDSNPLERIRLSPIILNKEIVKNIEVKLSNFIYKYFSDFMGVIQFDLIIQDDKWFVIELNSRLGAVSDLNKVSTNYDPYEAIIDIAEKLQIKKKIELSGRLALDLPLMGDKNIVKELQGKEIVEYVKTIKNKEHLLVTTGVSDFDEALNLINQLPLYNKEQLVNELNILKRSDFY